jgi:hypothetical protein
MDRLESDVDIMPTPGAETSGFWFGSSRKLPSAPSVLDPVAVRSHNDPALSTAPTAMTPSTLAGTDTSVTPEPAPPELPAAATTKTP